ncbi:MAG: hypothetical protein JW967_08235, partial [Dehalococcoidales bacterium]|nr:hypothetical protein [Dehalococcoidales bacterium]
MNSYRIGQIVRDIRKAMSISQEDLAFKPYIIRLRSLPQDHRTLLFAEAIPTGILQAVGFPKVYIPIPGGYSFASRMR